MREKNFRLDVKDAADPTFVNGVSRDKEAAEYQQYRSCDRNSAKTRAKGAKKALKLDQRNATPY